MQKGNTASGNSLQPSQAEANNSLPCWRLSTQRKGLMAPQDCLSHSSHKINPVRGQGNENTCCGHALHAQRNEPLVPSRKRFPPLLSVLKDKLPAQLPLYCEVQPSFLKEPSHPFPILTEGAEPHRKRGRDAAVLAALKPGCGNSSMRFLPCPPSHMSAMQTQISQIQCPGNWKSLRAKLSH